MVFEKGHYGVVLEYVPRGGLDEFIFQNKVIMRSLSMTVAVLMCAGWLRNSHSFIAVNHRKKI